MGVGISFNYDAEMRVEYFCIVPHPVAFTIAKTCFASVKGFIWFVWPDPWFRLPMIVCHHPRLCGAPDLLGPLTQSADEVPND